MADVPDSIDLDRHLELHGFGFNRRGLQLILLVIVMLLPDGLVGLATRLRARRRGPLGRAA